MRRLAIGVLLALALGTALAAQAPDPPELSKPVNDLAGVIDAQSAADMDRLIRALQAKTGDAVVVATVPSLEGYAGIEELAVKMFANGGRGIGEKGKDNGVLILVAPADRKARIEVGYDLESWITDGYAGETIREFMSPSFRQGRYGEGLLAATSRIVGRIAQARGVTLEGVPAPRRSPSGGGVPLWLIILIFILFTLLGRGGGGPGRRSRYWGSSGWSGWSSGVGSFGGGWSSGGGGGFGGGFGGFGGGRSGGGGASGSW